MLRKEVNFPEIPLFSNKYVESALRERGFTKDQAFLKHNSETRWDGCERYLASFADDRYFMVQFSNLARMMLVIPDNVPMPIALASHGNGGDICGYFMEKIPKVGILRDLFCSGSFNAGVGGSGLQFHVALKQTHTLLETLHKNRMAHGDITINHMSNVLIDRFTVKLIDPSVYLPGETIFDVKHRTHHGLSFEEFERMILEKDLKFIADTAPLLKSSSALQ